MSSRINGKETQESLQEAFSQDADLLKNVGTLFSFAQIAASGDPFGLTGGIGLILKTAGASIGAGVNIVRRLGDTAVKSQLPTMQHYKRFELLFYVTCQRCYLETIEDIVTKFSNSMEQKGQTDGLSGKESRELKNQLKHQIASLSDAEVTFLFCIEPLDGEFPLFQAFEKWLFTTLSFYGLNSLKARELAVQCTKEAHRRFHVHLSSRDDAASWMRDYLSLTRQRESQIQVATDLKAIKLSLARWTEPAALSKQRQAVAWASYRESLAQLPDQKETMFSEQFGVRRVFVQPRATYHVRGAAGCAGRPQLVPDLARLLGALVSSRVSGQDLVILCGGPGSGKSTLCRILASQLASDPEVFPVFLRLRRVREGAEIGQFIEESLQKLGLISRLADLRDIPNLVLILDGFDELVMASRSRLRHFFNVLRDDLGVGPLENAKAIVSGRDTLFPRGEGLPTGSHVLSLQPFDKIRVKTWGTKWRLLHKSSPGHTFHPEEFVKEDATGNAKPPLHHLVTWPLTLHLVARVHTAGKLEVKARAAQRVEKAYLYRSILAETSHRQSEQTGDQPGGTGRLDANKMREFLRALAWEMHHRSVDSMDPADVMPVLKLFYPDKNEQDLSELAEVAVVNCPELTKGEETGFEFVHKSFSEFLVAERFADEVERIAFQAQEYGRKELTWRMSEQEAARRLAPMLSVRPIPEEVQEMFEPMLGCFEQFCKNDSVNETVLMPVRRDGLARIVERFETLYADVLMGASLEMVSRTSAATAKKSQYEAYANYCAGILIIGTAAARHLRRYKVKGSPLRLFSGEPFRGAFWRCVCILAAGGITLDEALSTRLLDGMQIGTADDDSTHIGDADSPIKLGFLSRAKGYRPQLSELIKQFTSYQIQLERLSFGLLFMLRYVLEKLNPKAKLEHHVESPFDWPVFQSDAGPSPFSELLEQLAKAAIIEPGAEHVVHYNELEWRNWVMELEQLMNEEKTPSEILRRVLHAFPAMRLSPMRFHFRHWLRDIPRLNRQFIHSGIISAKRSST